MPTLTKGQKTLIESMALVENANAKTIADQLVIDEKVVQDFLDQQALLDKESPKTYEDGLHYTIDLIDNLMKQGGIKSTTSVQALSLRQKAAKELEELEGASGGEVVPFTIVPYGTVPSQQYSALSTTPVLNSSGRHMI